MAEDLMLELQELRQIQSTAKSPSLLNFISSRIENIQKQLSTATKVVTTPSISYSTLKSFSWDQDSEKVEIFLPLEGVNGEKIETAFKPTHVDIKVHDVHEKNYRCTIPKLYQEIVPEECKVLVKPTMVIITLFKASEGDWLYLYCNKPKTSADKDWVMDLVKFEDGFYIVL